MKMFDFLANKEFVDIMQNTLKQVLYMLLKHNVPFTILTDVSMVNFEPSLPNDIIGKFQKITLFELDGYTLSSARIVDDKLNFEAGFGKDNFASFVSVPILAILQIAIENRPIFLNMSVSTINVETKPSKESGFKRSMDVFLNNPENQNLIKK